MEDTILFQKAEISSMKQSISGLNKTCYDLQ